MKDTMLKCPAEHCEQSRSTVVGQLSSHIVDEHGWHKVAAEAAERQLRRELVGVALPQETERVLRVVARGGVIKHCGICREPGHRRETCPKRKTTIPDANDPVVEQTLAQINAPPSTPALSPLHIIGSVIDSLREAADALDDLVARGVIS